MKLTRLLPAGVGLDGDATLDLDSPATRDALLELYRPPRRPWLRLNFVTSVTGSAAGSDGTSGTLTSAADRRILGVIRELADVVLIGASSLRSEGYLFPKRARLAVVTASGDLGDLRLQGSDAERLIVVSPPTAVPGARGSAEGATFLTVPERDGRMAPDDIVDALRDAGLASIVCEGGPGLARQLVIAGLVDEACLTTSPRLTPTTLPLLGVDPFPERGLELAGLLSDGDGALYARWRVR